jgi:hypothetical protein
VDRPPRLGDVDLAIRDGAAQDPATGRPQVNGQELPKRAHWCGTTRWWDALVTPAPEK